MYDFLKNIALSNDWGFEYARQDYQNLYTEIEDGKVKMFCDPIITDSKFSDSGNETFSYSGKLMLLLSSDVDEDYQDKYAEYIQPLFSNSRQTLVNAFGCSNYQVTVFKTVEVINLFDQNFDGLLITYSVTLIE